MIDLVIVGAGPGGLAAAREAKSRGLDFLVLERRLVADTIHQFPVAKPLFSTPNELELVPGALSCRSQKPTREELLTHYTRFVVDNGIDVRTDEPALAIEPADGGFRVTSTKGRYEARIVLVATGINGFRKHLNVPGENDERVKYRFVDAYPYAGHPVLVAGSGNSAAETALFLEEVGAHVTLAMRRSGFERDPSTGKAEIKWWVRDPIVALRDAGRMNVRFDACIAEIGERTVTLLSHGMDREELPCDQVFALLGTTPDLRLLIGAGVEIDSEGVPVYDDSSFETNVRGIYVLGHITRARHIKGAIETAPLVVERIADALDLERSVV